jgi:hypothetical protein
VVPAVGIYIAGGSAVAAAACSNRKPKELESIVRMGEEKLVSIEDKVRLLTGMKKQLRSVIQELRGRQGWICPASSKPGVRNSSK